MMVDPDLAAARRQAFGAPFSARSDDVVVAQSLLEGQLRLSPHGVWDLPAAPSWREDPFEDSNWKFQFHSLRWLDVLRRAHMSGLSGAMERWEALVLSWLETNPPREGGYRWAWTDMSDAMRAMTLCFGLPHVQDRGPYVTALQLHADWLAEPRHLGRGNHALHQHAGLFVVASVLRDEERRELALTRLDDYLEANYDADGVNVEGSTGYHRLNLIWCQEVLRRVAVEELPLPHHASRLEGAALELAHASRPDGQLERIGDTDNGRATGVQSEYLEYVLSGGATGKPPAELTKIYGAGYVFGRTGWGETERPFSEETFYSACFGSSTKIHGHADGGSITFFANGVPWLVDSGKYSYQANEIRNYVISRRAHNVVDIPGRRYRRDGGVELVDSWQDDNFDSLLLRDNGYEGCGLERRVIFSRSGEYLLVIDTVRADGPVRVESRWNLAPEVRAVRTRRGYNLRARTSAASITWGGAMPELVSRAGSTDPMDGWFSTAWKRAQPTTALTARKEGTRLRMVAAICTREVGDDEGLRIVPVEGGLRCFVPARHGVEDILVRAESVERTDAGLTRFPQDPSGRGAIELGMGWVERIEAVMSDARARAAASEGDGEVLLSIRREVARVGASLAPPGPAAHGLDACLADLDVESEVCRAAPGSVRPGLTSYLRAPRRMLNSEVPLSIAHHAKPSFLQLSDDLVQLVSVDAGPVLVPSLLARGRGSVLVVGLHGAVDRSRMALPIFQRQRSHDALGLPYLLVSDPTLDLDPGLTLGWYLGSATHDVHRVVAELVEAVRVKLGLQQVLLVGSSGGGFAALQVAAHMEHASVLAFNPQTRIESYFRRLRDRALMAVFGRIPDDLRDERLDVVTRYSRVDGDISVCLVQNRGDIHHDACHRLPFVQSLRDSVSVRVETNFVDWGKGHVSPTAQQYSAHVLDSVARLEG